MTDKKDHLKIDMNFLDKKEVPKEAPKTEPTPVSTSSGGPTPNGPVATSVSSGYKYNWKNILIISGIILFIGWAIFSNGDSSSSTSGSSYTPTQNSGDTVIVGQYSCSSYAASQADSMAPSDAIKSQLSVEQDNLQAQSTRLDSQKNQLDNEYVDETDQSAIDSYNYQVNSYNSQLASYQSDSSSLSDRIDAYNAQVQRYNNYLDSNCTKRY